MKLRDTLKANIRSADLSVDLAREALATAQKVAPQLLDYDADCKRLYTMGGLGVNVAYVVDTPKQGRLLAAELMDILGAHTAEKREMLGKTYSIIIEAPNIRVDIDVPKQDCRKALVTQTRVIEFCGELDESQYENVEYLEDIE